MALTVAQKGYNYIFAGTTSEVLTAIVDYKHPRVVSMFFNSGDSRYHIFATVQ